MDITDPYSAYCFDTACAYILDRVNHHQFPRFPEEQKPKGKAWTTNSDLIAEMQRGNKR